MHGITERIQILWFRFASQNSAFFSVYPCWIDQESRNRARKGFSHAKIFENYCVLALWGRGRIAFKISTFDSRHGISLAIANVSGCWVGPESQNGARAASGKGLCWCSRPRQDTEISNNFLKLIWFNANFRTNLGLLYRLRPDFKWI